MNVDVLKGQARRLSKRLIADGFEVKLSNAYEALAAVYGERDWNTLVARAGTETSTTSAEEIELTRDELRIWKVFELLLSSMLAKPVLPGHRALAYWVGHTAFLSELGISTAIEEAVLDFSHYDVSKLLLSGLKKKGWLNMTPMGTDSPAWHLWDVSIQYNADQGGRTEYGVWVINVPEHIEVTARSCAAVTIVNMRFAVRTTFSLSTQALKILPGNRTLTLETPLEYAAGIRVSSGYRTAAQQRSIGTLPERRSDYVGAPEQKHFVLESSDSRTGLPRHTLIMGPSGRGRSMLASILPPEKLPELKLVDLGLHPEDLQEIRTVMEQRAGLVVACGPAGAGRSTTLAALARSYPHSKLIGDLRGSHATELTAAPLASNLVLLGVQADSVNACLKELLRLGFTEAELNRHLRAVVLQTRLASNSSQETPETRYQLKVQTAVFTAARTPSQALAGKVWWPVYPRGNFGQSDEALTQNPATRISRRASKPVD